MDMEISFPGGKRVVADYKGFTIETDQPESSGGEASAPAPFDLFLASIGTCAGIFALGFMEQRGLPADQARIVLKTEYDKEKRLIGKISIALHTPPDFPEKYEAAIIRAMDLCAVKRHMVDPPDFDVTVVKA